MNPERERLRDYLAAFGLDISEVSERYTSEGFYLVRQGADPDWLHNWPDGFNYEWFRTLHLVANAADLRRAGIRKAM